MQTTIIKNKEAENANLRNAAAERDTQEAGTARERFLTQKIADLEAKIIKHEKDNKELRKGNVEKDIKIKEIHAQMNRESAAHGHDITGYQQRMARSNEQHAATQLILEQRITQLQSADVRELTQRLKTMTDNRNMLQRQLDHSQQRVVPGPTHYETLLAMAVCMNKMGKEDEDSGSLIFEPKLSFQEHSNLLVKKCLEDCGLSLKQVGDCQTRVFGLLNKVYVAGAQRGEHVDVVTRISAGMAKVGRKKQRGHDEFGRPV